MEVFYIMIVPFCIVMLGVAYMYFKMFDKKKKKKVS